MDCQEVYNLMNRYLDGEITPEEERVLEVHLGRCKHCQKEFGELKEMQQMLETIEPSHDFTAKVMQRIAEEKKPKYTRWLPKTRTGWIAAAIFVCVILSAPYWFADPGEVIISKGEVQTGVLENGEQGVKVIEGEIRIKGLQGTLTAINSQIFVENPKADLKPGFFDEVRAHVVKVWQHVKSWFKKD